MTTSDERYYPSNDLLEAIYRPRDFPLYVVGFIKNRRRRPEYYKKKSDRDKIYRLYKKKYKSTYKETSPPPMSVKERTQKNKDAICDSNPIFTMLAKQEKL